MTVYFNQYHFNNTGLMLKKILYECNRMGKVFEDKRMIIWIQVMLEFTV